MAHGIKQVLLRPAMGIMAGNARFRPWRNSMMCFGKTSRFLIMALGAELTE